MGWSHPSDLRVQRADDYTLAQEQEKAIKREQRIAGATVKSSKLLKHPLAASITLSRELGQLSTRISRETILKTTWGLALNCTSLLNFGDKMIGETRTSAFIDSINGGVSTLVKDEATGSIIAGGLHDVNSHFGKVV